MKTSVGKILATQRKKIKMKQSDLAKHLEDYDYHIKSNSISSWENDVSIPNAEQFLAACEIMGITDIYERFIGNNPNNLMSELNDEGQKKVKEYIELLIASGKYQCQNEELIPLSRTIRLFNIPASAGTGEFLDNEEYEEITVGSEVPLSADFGIRINGDSMEPQFVNDQIVWVEQTNDIKNGDIGIFFLNGNAYCKKLQILNNNIQLISLNPKYSPLTITENSIFHTFGKVVG